MKPAMKLAEKWRKYSVYGILGLISTAFLLNGGMKVIGIDMMISNMAEVGYPPAATRAIGIFEVIAVAGLWKDSTRTISLSALILLMAGAAGTHFTAGDTIRGLIVFIIAGILGLAIYLDRGEELQNFLLKAD